MLVTSIVTFSQSRDAANILNVLDLQTKAWNSGNIEKFMEGYLRNDSIMFIGKSGITYGWQKTFENYKKGYPDTAAMGKLDFKIVEVKPLSASNYFVVGKWHLARSIGDIGGTFTLLFQKVKNRWFIIVDHSS